MSKKFCFKKSFNLLTLELQAYVEGMVYYYLTDEY